MRLGVGLPGVKGESFDVLNHSRCEAPTVFAEGAAEQVSTRECRVGPQVVLMLGRPGHLFEIEAIDLRCVLAVWKPQQKARHCESNPTGLFRSAEGLPGAMVGGVLIARRNRFGDEGRPRCPCDQTELT